MTKKRQHQPITSPSTTMYNHQHNPYPLKPRTDTTTTNYSLATSPPPPTPKIFPKNPNPSLPKAVPTPTTSAPTARILANPSESPTPPTQIISTPLNPSCEFNIPLRIFTFPNASGCKGAPANPPIPSPEAEGRAGEYP